MVKQTKFRIVVDAVNYSKKAKDYYSAYDDQLTGIVILRGYKNNDVLFYINGYNYTKEAWFNTLSEENQVLALFELDVWR